MKHNISKAYTPDELGRKSLKKRKENGVVFTPPNLATYVADKLVSLFYSDQLKYNNVKKLTNLKLIDPACGEGELLIASWKKLRQLFKDQKLDLKSVICGIDLDSQSVIKTSNKIEKLKPKLKQSKYNSSP